MTRAAGLAKVQAEVAALLMEPGRLDAFAADPRAYARKAGLKGAHADLLAGLPVEGARYFASRRRIDRFGYLRGDLPRSVALLDREGALDAYFAQFPYAFEAPMKEVARVARWARRARVSAVARDVVAVESAAVRLLHAPHRMAKPSKRPRRAPGVRLVRVGHDPEHFFHDHAWTPRPGAFTVVLQRTADDVEMPALKPAELAALRAADGRRTEAELGAAVVRLRRLGLLA